MVQYFQGDLLTSGCGAICHQTNCVGVMGSGIARQIRDSYPAAYEALRYRYNNGQVMLGECDFVFTELKSKNGHGYYGYVVNCYSQFNYLPRGVKHTDYDAFRACCKKIKKEFKYFTDFRIGFPYKIGSGLGGGDWEVMKNIIEEEFKDPEWRVEVWQLNC